MARRTIAASLALHIWPFEWTTGRGFASGVARHVCANCQCLLMWTAGTVQTLSGNLQFFHNRQTNCNPMFSIFLFFFPKIFKGALRWILRLSLCGASPSCTPQASHKIQDYIRTWPFSLRMRLNTATHPFFWHISGKGTCHSVWSPLKIKHQ